MIKRILTLATDRIYSLPVIVLMPHSSCNCRCVMCDIWKANSTRKEISSETLKKHVGEFRKLGVREVILSGGEALMHSNLWNFCYILKEQRLRVTLLSTGLLFRRHATEIITHIDGVIVSLDGNEEVHDHIRNIPGAFAKMAEGISELKKLNSKFSVTGRSVLQRRNFRVFIDIVRTARRIGLDHISFLAADVSSQAFNHPGGWQGEKISEVALRESETLEFEEILERSFRELRSDYASGFISESPFKMKRILQYYKAINGMGKFPGTVCNAPWVSAVIEPDGSVLPCFFHKPYGNIYENSFSGIINSKEARVFRRNLNMSANDICKKCVCSIKLRPYQTM